MDALKAGRYYLPWQELLSFELLTIPAGDVKVYRSMDRTLTRASTLAFSLIWTDRPDLGHYIQIEF
jgi:hypothetical protein